MNFTNFAFNPAVAEGARKAGYVTPTPIQNKAIPEVLKGRDVMGLAQTGTGKTAAFVLPILNRLMNGRRTGIRSLIIAPTRELAEQINDAIKILDHHTRLRSTVAYGGVSINRQIDELKRADIVVGCPGRLLDHLARKTLDLSKLEVLVLDEADQMFDMGFFKDIRRILTHAPRKNRQTLLFSATMPKEIRGLANEVLRNPVTVQIGMAAPAETVSHAMFPVAEHLKTDLLIKLLGENGIGSILVFTRTKHRAKRLGEKLTRAGYRSTSLQGNLSQARRQAALNGFKSGEYQILVATDIAARGIDISNVSHVINYDIPSTTEAYIHRIGRTGRAECTGKAFTLITGEDTQMVKAIDRAIGSAVERRSLADFNYGASPAPRNTKPRPHGGRPRANGKRPQAAEKTRASRPKARSGRRPAKGVFAAFSPRNSQNTGAQSAA